MRKLASIFFSFCILNAASQTASIKGSVCGEADSLFNIYHPASQEKYSALYNGREYYGYPGRIEGDAFFPVKRWAAGSILYDGVWYRDVQLMYDICRDELIVRHPNGIPVILFGPRIREFSIEGQLFTRLRSEGSDKIPDGFYQVITSGHVIAYVRRVKRLDEKIEGMVLERKFLREDVFFVRKESRYYPVRSQRTLYNVLRGKRQAIHQYRRRAGIKYKKDAEQFIYRIVEYYNQITP